MKTKSRQNIRVSSIVNLLKAKLRGKNAVSLFLLVLVSVFVIYPLVMIFLKTFGSTVSPTLDSYREAFSSSSTYKAISNTLIMIFNVLAGAWIFGFSLAFLRQKTDFRHKKTLDTLVFLAFSIPSYILSISWIEIMSRGGYLNRFLNALFPDMDYSVNAYSLNATAIVLSLHLYPLVYYGMSNALKLANASLEQSAKICGASKLRILFTIVIPLIIPTFFSTGILVLSRSMANFGVTAQLALPVGKEVLTTRIFTALSDLNLPLVAVLSLILVFVSFALYLFSERIINRNRFSFEGSRTVHLFKLGKYSRILETLVIFFFGATVVLPYSTIIISSFLKRWGLKLTPEHFTIGNYIQLFSGERLIVEPLFNSLSYGITAALAAAIFSSFMVYLNKFNPSKVSTLLVNTAQLPIAFPNMILAIGAMLAWINEPFKLYGTCWILIVTYFVLFTPICIKQILGVSKNLDASTDYAGQIVGIPLFKRYKDIFLPQIKDGILAGFLLCFLISLREIPISLLLYSAGTKTLGVMLFTIQSNSYGLEMTSTVAVIVIVVSLSVNLLLRKIQSRKGRDYE